MKAKEIIILTGISFFVFLAGCSLDRFDETRYITGEGPVTSIPIHVDTFTSIQHGSIGNMIITVGDSFSVTFKGQENVLSEMIYQQKQEVFYWGIRENVQLVEYDTILVEIQLPAPVENVFMQGLGNIFIYGPRQSASSLFLSGIGNIDAYGLDLTEAAVFLNGNGNIKVRVSEKLTGLLSGNGNVYYKGDPEIDLPVTGSGLIVDEN